MPAFSISRFIILLRPLWISAGFLLLSTGPILDSTDRLIHALQIEKSFYIALPRNGTKNM